jgi:NodT family efflux transporter outer membrane factor (OMF) lipoprotein
MAGKHDYSRTRRMSLPAGFSNAKRMKHVIARAIMCSTLLVLPSCHIPKIRQSELGLGLPASFNGATSSDNSAQLRVEEFYNDPILARLVCQALANNRELKILEEEVQIARNEILSRRGAYLPFVGFRGTGGMDKPSLFTPEGQAEKQLEYFPGKHFPDPLPNVLTSLNIFWQLDIWRELRNARDAAAQRYVAAIEKRNYFLTRLVADIAENYYGLMALDKRLENLDRIIELQQQSYEFAKARFDAGRGTELAVQRFLAEVRKNQSEKLIVRQEIVEVENRINFLAGRFPQPVERVSAGFYDLNIHALSVGVPAQLLQNRPDIRQAERELAAAGLDVKVARAHFFPRLDITAGVGYQAFNPKYLFMTPEALIANAAGDLTAPLINKAAIKAEYLSANARQLESVYTYQRVILNAFTEVINRLSMVENYRKSIEIRKQQLTALETSVDVATKLFQNARTEYIEVLFAQRDLLDARMILIDTKRQQLSAIVNAYQALGGGYLMSCPPPDLHLDAPEPPRPPELPQLPAPREVPQLPAPRKEKDAP